MSWIPLETSQKPLGDFLETSRNLSDFDETIGKPPLGYYLSEPLGNLSETLTLNQNFESVSTAQYDQSYPKQGGTPDPAGNTGCRENSFDDEAGLQRRQDALDRFRDDFWKGGWYTWESNGMAVVCYWNWRPERYLPLPHGHTRFQVCRYRSTWLVKSDGDMRWVHHEWSKSTMTIGQADEANFRRNDDTTRYKAAIHFFTTKHLGEFTVPHLRDQLTHMINFAIHSKKKMLQCLIYHDEAPRTVNRPRHDSEEGPEAEEALMVSEVSLPMYEQPSLTNLLSNVDEPCCMILDTGCQRQVAGKEWHRVHQGRLGQLLPLE